VVRGHRIQDVVLVHNHGPSDAEEVMLDYQAPKGTELVSVRAGGRRCSRSLPLTCRLGLLKPGRRTKVTVVMVSRKRSGPFRMHAALGSATYDPALSGNAVNERVFILPPPPTQPVACGARATPVAHIAC
jgi:hypothetical protein